MTTIEPAPTRTDYAAQLAEVPSTAALQAALRHGALVARVGTKGADGHAWLCDRGRWMHDDGRVRIPCAEAEVPEDVEVIDWPGATNPAKLDAKLAEIAAAEYEAIAEIAARDGETGELLAAAESLRALGLLDLDESLYERLTATRSEMADRVWIDEDCFRGDDDR